MKKNILNLYEGFLDDLDKLNKNQDDGFRGTNDQVYDEYDYILSPYKNPEFFEGLCNMCKDKGFQYNENGFTQKDLDKITYIDSDYNDYSYFKKVTSLDELQYFNNLKTIGNYCFSDCLNLKSVIFPQNLEKIEIDTFYNCVSLKELKIPNFLKEINKFAFYNCVSLEKIIIPKNIQVIRKYAFCYCTSLKEIVIPKNIKNIGDFAFEHCSSLKEIVIPKRFKSLMKYIFYEVNLTKVNITYI